MLNILAPLELFRATLTLRLRTVSEAPRRPWERSFSRSLGKWALRWSLCRSSTGTTCTVDPVPAERRFRDGARRGEGGAATAGRVGGVGWLGFAVHETRIRISQKRIHPVVKFKITRSKTMLRYVEVCCSLLFSKLRWRWLLYAFVLQRLAKGGWIRRMDKNIT